MGYFDTSVLIPYYCPERLSDTAERALLQSTNRNISKLSEVEFASALSLKIRTGVFDIDTARKAEFQFKSHLSICRRSARRRIHESIE